MKKKELEEVFFIEKEIKDLEKRIKNYEENPKTIKSIGKRSSSSFPYIEEHYTIECVVHNPKVDILKLKLQNFKIKLENKKQEIETYIEKIPFSEIRQLFRFRYLDNKNWIQISHEMNKSYYPKEYTEDSVRRKHDRYLEKN